LRGPIYTSPEVRDTSGDAPRVLVVGWGFLGAAVGHALFESGAGVCGLTRSETPRTRAASALGMHVLVADAADPGMVERSIRGVDHVVYVAGGLDPVTAAQRPLDDALGTLTPLLCTLEALRQAGTGSFTYVSSGGAVYGNPAHTMAGETDPLRPVSAYGVSRLAGESYSQMYATTFDIPTRIVRCANVYGPGQSPTGPQGAVAVFLHRVAAGVAVKVVGDGTAIRDYVHIDDVTGALSQLVLDDVDCGTVNVGSGAGHTVIELLGVVGDIVGRTPVCEFVASRPHDVAAIVLDIAKVRSLIPYEPRSIGDGVRATWNALTASVGAVGGSSLR
jgi:UDP-glucose 4-epimerase